MDDFHQHLQTGSQSCSLTYLFQQALLQTTSSMSTRTALIKWVPVRDLPHVSGCDSHSMKKPLSKLPHKPLLKLRCRTCTGSSRAFIPRGAGVFGRVGASDRFGATAIWVVLIRRGAAYTANATKAAKANMKYFCCISNF